MEKLPKELIMKLALELDDDSLRNYCKSLKKFEDFTCNNYIFWMNKILKEFGWVYEGDKRLQAIKNSYKVLKYWWDPKTHKKLNDRIINKNPGLKNLTTLDANNNPDITDASVKDMKVLTILKADNNPNIIDESVKNLTELRTFYARFNSGISDEGVKNLKKLNILYSYGNRNIYNPNPDKIYMNK